MIIQRWQSLLLLLTTALMACFMFVSLGQLQTFDVTYNFTSLGFFPEGEATGGAAPGTYYTWIFFIVSMLGVLLPFICIFLFKNLALQMRVCLVTLLFEIADIAVAFSTGYNTIEGGTMQWSPNVGCAFVAIATTILAYYCMRGDRNKLRSIDRLR